MNYDDTEIGHQVYIRKTQSRAIRNFQIFMQGNGRLSEFEEAVSIETKSEFSDYTKESPDKTTEYERILKHEKINGFEEQVVKVLSEESTL